MVVFIIILSINFFLFIYLKYTYYIDKKNGLENKNLNLIEKNIDNNNPIIVANCDQIVSWDLSLFLHYCKLNNLDSYNRLNKHFESS